MFNALPESCYCLNKVDNKAIIIKRGETGYYRTDWTASYTQEMIDEMNIQLGVTKAEARAMEIGSMFGWDVPGANPENYNEDGSPKRSEAAQEETDTSESKLEALAAYLGCESDDIRQNDMYNENLFEYGRQEYLVLTDEEADEKAAENIRESLWAFNAEFIGSHSRVRLGDKAIKALKKMQAELCEDANDLVEALIDDMDAFIEDAIESDGRGHFMNTYDGEEHEQDEYYIYRQN